MRTFDLSPLFRNTVGFDRFDRLFDTAFNTVEAQGFPAYDITRHGEHDYRITLAVAGRRPGRCGTSKRTSRPVCGSGRGCRGRSTMR